MSDEKREGFVIRFTPPQGRDYVSAVKGNGDADITDDPEEAIVFFDRRSAASCLADRLNVETVPLADAVATRPKPLGQVAAEAFDKVREGQHGARLPAAYTLTEKQWEAVAQAVVEEHERRKR